MYNFNVLSARLSVLKITDILNENITENTGEKRKIYKPKKNLYQTNTNINIDGDSSPILHVYTIVPTTGLVELEKYTNKTENMKNLFNEFFF